MLKKRLKSESGVALMIVLAAIVFLVPFTFDFMFKAGISHELAKHQEERVKAYFLAESAIRLMELELKLEKQLRSNVSGQAGADSIAGNLSGPLCAEFPISTSMIRAIFLGEAMPGGEGEEGEGGEEAGGAEAAEEATGMPAAFIGGMQKEAAEEFLNFDGDFEGQCMDESSKFNLNMFSGKDPLEQAVSGVNSYDRMKQILTTFLTRPVYKKLFPEDEPQRVTEVVRNIADWVDTNDRMNEMGRVSTGAESSLYPLGISDYTVKNGKYLTLDELYMVAGVEDDWFTPIKENFSVYGGEKINVCLASDEVVAALIVQYANANPNIPNVDPGDVQKLSNLVIVVKGACTGLNPKATDIEAALNTALGAAATSSGGGGAGSSFADMITTESRYYTLIGKGIVGSTEVKITSVLDTSESSASRWRFVYWNVE